MILGKKYRLSSILVVLTMILSISVVGCGAKTATPPSNPTATPATIVPDTAFFKDKTIKFIVATAPGGGYDSYARLVAPYLQKYLPGSTVIVENAPGAGHIIGATQVYNAKPDGLTLGCFNSGLIQQQLISNKDIRFDLNKFTWLAKSTTETPSIIVGKSSPYQTFEAMIKATTPVKFGSAGVGSESNTNPLITAEIFKFPVKMVAGYNGPAGETGLMRGELNAIGASYGSEQGFVETGEGKVILQMGIVKNNDIKAVPWIMDLLKDNPKGQSLATALAATSSIGKPFVTTPGVSPERTAALVDAMKKAFADQEMKDKAEKIKLYLDPVFGQELADMVTKALDQSPENIKILTDILSAK